MLTGWHPAHFSLVAAAVTVVLGLLVLLRAPGRGVNRAFFATAVLHGALAALTARVFLAPGTAESLPFVRVFWLLDPWFASFIIILALHLPTSSGIVAKRPVLVHSILLAPAAILSGLFLWDLSLFLTPVVFQGFLAYTLTPLGASLPVLRGVALAAALVVLARRFKLTPHALQRTQLAWAQAAFLVGFAPFVTLSLVRQWTTNPESYAVFGFAAAAVFVHGAAVSSLRPWNGSLMKDADRQVILITYLVGVSMSVSMGVLGAQFARFVFSAALIVAFPLLIGYSIVKYDLFGLDLRLRRAAPHAVLVILLAASFTFFTTISLRLSPTADAATAFAAAAVLTGAVALPVQRASSRISTRLGWTRADNAGAVAERRLEIYRAAIETALTREEDPDGSPWLADLRERLDLNERDHRVILQLVQSAPQDAARPTGPLRPGDFVMGKYRVERFLGSGSFGRAVLARHVSMDRLVVIKEPHEAHRSRAALQRLSKEARLAARIHHPNVVSLHDFEEMTGTGYLVFEYVAGGSLEDRLRSGPLPREEAHRIFRDLLEGLDAIHAAGIVHMDLKPANILLDSSGHAKITDFGIASEVRASETLARSIGPQAHPGTLLYMAPEQVRGRRDPGPKADLYAAGAILHEMLTGAPYLDFSPSPLLVQEAILYETPRLDHPLLTPREQDLLGMLLAKAPGDRPPRASNILAETSDWMTRQGANAIATDPFAVGGNGPVDIVREA